MKRSEDFFEILQSRSCTKGDRRENFVCNCGAAAARCTEGERSEPFVQRFSGFAKVADF
jgi:hypothetical protein